MYSPPRTLGREWLSPHASFHESTPVQLPPQVVYQPRFPSLNTMLLTKCPSSGWGSIMMKFSTWEKNINPTTNGI